MSPLSAAKNYKTTAGMLPHTIYLMSETLRRDGIAFTQVSQSLSILYAATFPLLYCSFFCFNLFSLRALSLFVLLCMCCFGEIKKTCITFGQEIKQTYSTDHKPTHCAIARSAVITTQNLSVSTNQTHCCQLTWSSLMLQRSLKTLQFVNYDSVCANLWSNIMPLLYL